MLSDASYLSRRSVFLYLLGSCLVWSCYHLTFPTASNTTSDNKGLQLNPDDCFAKQKSKSTLITVAKEVFFDSLQYNDANIVESNHKKGIHMNERFWMCTAPKTGCTGWAYFYLYINNGVVIPREKAKNQPGLIHTKYQDEKKSWTAFNLNLTKDEASSLFSRYPHIVVARNPYVRFISSWNDWKSRTKENITLEEFTDRYEAREGFPFIDHTDSVSTNCFVNNPLNYTVLRVEQEPLWFDAMMETFNLTTQLKEYHDLGGPILFEPYVTDGDSLAPYVASASGYASWPGKAFESSHHRGSADKVLLHFTPQLAARVTRLFMDDFVNFGYPLWDGQKHTFRYV